MKEQKTITPLLSMFGLIVYPYRLFGVMTLTVFISVY